MQELGQISSGRQPRQKNPRRIYYEIAIDTIDREAYRKKAKNTGLIKNIHLGTLEKYFDLQVATIRAKAAQAQAREEALRSELEKLDKLSRFQVRPTSDVIIVPQVFDSKVLQYYVLKVIGI